MGSFDEIVRNSSEIDIKEMQKDFDNILRASKSIEKALQIDS